MLHVCFTTRESITGHLVRADHSSARGKLCEQVICTCRRWSPAPSDSVMSNESEGPPGGCLPAGAGKARTPNSPAGTRLIIQYVTMTSRLCINGHADLRLRDHLPQVPTELFFLFVVDNNNLMWKQQSEAPGHKSNFFANFAIFSVALWPKYAIHGKYISQTVHGPSLVQGFPNFSISFKSRTPVANTRKCYESTFRMYFLIFYSHRIINI